jgi:molybdopterin molybdotransferase
VPELLTIEEALERVLAHTRPLVAELVETSAAAGRIVAEPARARADLPPFASSAMDGFAVRADDTPGLLPIAFRVAAGSPSTVELPAEAAAGIATGGVVPVGADAVVPVELTVEQDGRVDIRNAVTPGSHVRPRGGDVKEGDIVVAPGTRLGAAQIGALAAAGVAGVACSMRPRVAVLATGSELRAPGEPLGPGQIYESNRALVAVVLAAAGARVDQLPAVADDENAHVEALTRGLEADVLVTSGGVSVGPHDLVREVSASLGVSEVFWGVAVKPGKPLSFGTRGDTLVFGLPGNPVSSLVGTLLFVRPAVLALQGLADPRPQYEIGMAGTALRRNPRRDELVRARRRAAETGFLLEPLGGQESHMIVRASAADALVHVPRGEGEIPKHAPVRYLPLT